MRELNKLDEDKKLSQEPFLIILFVYFYSIPFRMVVEHFNRKHPTNHGLTDGNRC